MISLVWRSSFRLAFLLGAIFVSTLAFAAVQEEAEALIKRLVAVAIENTDGQRNGELKNLHQQLVALPKPSMVTDAKKATEATRQGQAAFEAKQYEQAKKYFLEAREVAPADETIAIHLAATYFKMGDFASAFPVITNVVALIPGSEFSWSALAAYYAHQNQPHEAAAAYILALRFAENQTAARALLETIAADAGKHRIIREAAQQALTIAQKGGSLASPAVAPKTPANAATPAKQQASPSPTPAVSAAAPSGSVTPSPSPAAASVQSTPEAFQPSSFDTAMAAIGPLATTVWTGLSSLVAGFDVAKLWGWPLAIVVLLAALLGSVSLWRRLAIQRQALAERARAGGGRLYQRLQQAHHDFLKPAGLRLFGWLQRMAIGVKQHPAAFTVVVVLVLGYLFLPHWMFWLAVALPLAVLLWRRYPASLRALFDFFTQQVRPRLKSWLLALWKGMNTLLNTLASWLRHLPRLLARMLLYGLWIAAVSWLVFDINHVYVEYEKGIREPIHIMNLQVTAEARYYAEIMSIRLNLAFWALLGAMGLALFWSVPNKWLRGNRGGWLALSLSMFFGYPAVAWAAGYFLWIPFWLLRFLAEPIVLSLAGMLVSLALFLSLSLLLGLFIGPVLLFFNQLIDLENALHIFRYKRSGLLGRLMQFRYWLRGEEWPDRPDDTKGSRFATEAEINGLRNPSGAVFGHIQNAPLHLPNDKHVLIMASTRSGKGVSLIIPHLLRYRGSAFVLDPKGENARATGRHRATLNDEVHYLDPFGISGKPKSRFNPLAHFTPANMEAESKALAGALVMGEGGQRDHWTASAQQLLAALILYVYAAPDIAPEYKDLPFV